MSKWGSYKCAAKNFSEGWWVGLGWMVLFFFFFLIYGELGWV